MSIYAGLAEALAAREEDVWKVDFAELERAIGRNLPSSAYKYPAWWSNNPSNNAMTKIWLRAGWRTEQVDVPGRTVVFRRATAAGRAGAAGPSDRARDFEYAAAPERLEYKAFGVGGRGPAYEKAAAGEPRRPAVDDLIERPMEDWLMELQDFVKHTVTFAPDFDPAEPAVTPEEWAAMEAEMEAEWDELYGRSINLARDAKERKESRS